MVLLIFIHCPFDKIIIEGSNVDYSLHLSRCSISMSIVLNAFVGWKKQQKCDLIKNSNQTGVKLTIMISAQYLHINCQWMLQKIIKFQLGSDSYLHLNCFWQVLCGWELPDVWLEHYFSLWSLCVVVVLGGAELVSQSEKVSDEIVFWCNVFG